MTQPYLHSYKKHVLTQCFNNFMTFSANEYSVLGS